MDTRSDADDIDDVWLAIGGVCSFNKQRRL